MTLALALALAFGGIEPRQAGQVIPADMIELFDQVCFQGGGTFDVSVMKVLPPDQLPQKIRRFRQSAGSYYRVITGREDAFLLLGEPSTENVYARSCTVIGRGSILEGIALIQPGGVILPADLPMFSNSAGYSTTSAAGYQYSVSKLDRKTIIMSIAFPTKGPHARVIERMRAIDRVRDGIGPRIENSVQESNHQ